LDNFSMPIFDGPASGIIEIDPHIPFGAMPADDSTLGSLLASFAHRETLAEAWPEAILEGPAGSRYPRNLTVRPVTLRADLVQLAADLQREYAQSADARRSGNSPSREADGG
jgi:hypothetical protein